MAVLKYVFLVFAVLLLVYALISLIMKIKKKRKLKKMSGEFEHKREELGVQKLDDEKLNKVDDLPTNQVKNE